MHSRRDSRGKPSPREVEDTQGECDPTSEQQSYETDLSSDAPPPPPPPPTTRGAANHPNREFRVCQTDSSYIPRPGSGNSPYIIPEQVSAVVSADAGQGFLRRESGMSPDGFPSRSMEEGGVSGLSGRRESIRPTDSATGTDSHSASSSPGLGPAESPASADYNGSLHTARSVTIRPLRLGQPGGEGNGQHRVPSPAALDRMDEMIEGTERSWTGYRRGAATAPTQGRAGHGNGVVLTGDRETGITASDSGGTATRAGGRAGPPRTSAPSYTTQGHQAGVNRSTAQPPCPPSPTPSESSIAETVFDVRRPTPPPPPHRSTASRRPPDTALLPSSRRHAAGSSGGLQRGGSYPPPSNARQERAVPGVLVPGGSYPGPLNVGQAGDVPRVLIPGTLLGLGGSHPRPPQVSRGQGQERGPGEDEERRRRDTRRK